MVSEGAEIPKRFPNSEIFAREVRVLEIHVRLSRGSNAVLTDLAALDKQPQDLRVSILNTVMKAHVRHKEPDRAVAAADRLAEIAIKPEDVYNAASGCAQCVSLNDDREVKEHYAAHAVALLTQAVAKGYKGVAHIKKDADLDALRDRNDFKMLLRELEAMKPDKPN